MPTGKPGMDRGPEGRLSLPEVCPVTSSPRLAALLRLLDHHLVWAGVVLVLGMVSATAGPDALVADPLGEGANHLWMFWRARLRLLGHTAPVANLPVGVDIPLMDPVNLPAYALGAVAGPAAGWRALVLANLALAMAGGHALARAFVGPRAATVAMVAAGTAPFLAGVMDFGITESWPLGCFGLHLALLLRHARTGRPRDALLAGLCLGLVALSGWYHAFFGLVFTAVTVPVLGAVAWRRGARRPGLIWQGLVAAVLVAPALWRFLAVRERWTPRMRLPAPGPPGPRPDWGELPVFGADLLTFVLPHPAAVHPSKATYLGLVLLALAAVGVGRRWAARWLVLASLPFVALAAGYWPTAGGVALGIPGPAKLLVEAVPALLGLSHWQRALGPATVLLAGAAAVGAVPIVRRRGGVFVLCAAIVADAGWGGATAWPRSTTPLVLPASLAALPPGPGGLVQLPFDNGRRPFSDEPPRIYQRWQVLHGRPISENYEGVDALLARSALVAHLDEACSVATTLPPYYQPPPEMRGLGAPADLEGELAALRAAGLRWLVLHRDRCRTPAKAIRRIEGLLGPRQDVGEGDALWSLGP